MYTCGSQHHTPASSVHFKERDVLCLVDNARKVGQQIENSIVSSSLSLEKAMQRSCLVLAG